MSGARISTQHPKWQPRCEFEATLKGEYCEQIGEVRLDGLLLCEWHARKLESQDKIDRRRACAHGRAARRRAARRGSRTAAAHRSSRSLNAAWRRDVRLEGLLLCDSHARRLEAQERIDLLRGIVSCLELCLSNITLRRDTTLVGLLRAERAGAARELEFAYEELSQAAM